MNDPFDTFQQLIDAAPDANIIPAPSNIIPIHQAGAGAVTVNARDLHAFLQVGKVFAAWITERIEQFGFVEGTDFQVISEIGKKPQGGRPSKEYALSLDMAKELSMVERSARGKQARQYFIECEKNLRAASNPSLAVFEDPAAMRGILLGYCEKLIEAKAEIANLAPKAAGLDLIADAEGTFCISDAAKSLNMRPQDLFTLLSNDRWIFKRGNEWVPFQTKLSAGLMQTKVFLYQDSNRQDRTRTQARITAKGLAKLAELKGKGVA